MEFRDYYKALGVARDASPEEIKRAFRKAARLHHPDISTGPEAEAKFKEVNEAYEVLKDPEKRAAYDQLGREPPPGAGRYQPPPGWDGGFEFTQAGGRGDEGFSDFFENLFRGRDAGMRAAPGADRHARIEISIEDAYRGATRTLTLRMPVVGPGGEVHMQDRNLAVTIPRGIAEGQHIRLAGQGSGGFGGGPAGDMFLEVSFAPHPLYRPEGRDLYVDLPIAPWEAALGAKVVMPTPGGKVDLRVPANARSGQKLRLRGKGLPGPPPGDIFATLKIVNPKVTTEKARQYFEKMAQDMPFDPRAHMGG